MLQNSSEVLREFDDRKQDMYELFPAAAVEIEATADLVYDNPDLCSVGHEIFAIIADNQTAVNPDLNEMISTQA